MFVTIFSCCSDAMIMEWETRTDNLARVLTFLNILTNFISTLLLILEGDIAAYTIVSKILLTCIRTLLCNP